jgi:hypothetical protein
MSKLLSILGLTALLTGACMQHASPSPLPLECRIEPQSPSKAGGPAEIRFVLTNPSSDPVWFLRWNTPFEGWRGTIFTVTDPDGTEVPYAGPMVKRGDPGREEYVEIPAGGSVDAEVDLANVYDLGKPGRYRLQVTGGLIDLTTDGASVPRTREQHQGADLRCGEVTLEIGPQG